jgi:aspartyl-tRNA(Asn)/glutamyl-tRNA(Gln) amidotransferase subunit A
MKGKWGPLAAIARDVLSGQSTATAQVRQALDLLGQLDTGPEGLNAFISYDATGAEAAARVVDEEIAAGRGGGPLAGVPIAVKDNICTLDLPTTCGSRILEGYRSPFEATAVRRLREAGAVMVGKTNMDEFAMGSSTENSAFGATRNPIDNGRVAGGSSGGSAAAVAAGIVPAALGSETGGSVRQPAAFCGIVGLKPSYGRISRYGLVGFASSLDQIGIFSRSVADAALLLELMAGPDRFDSTAAERPAPDLGVALEEGIEGMVIGIPREYFPPELDQGIAGICRTTVERLRAAGAEVREISLPHTRYAIPTYYLLAPAEVASNLARFDGVRYGMRAPNAESTTDVYEETRSLGFGTEVKRRIMLGTYALSAGHYDEYYGRAQRARALIARDFRQAFDSGVDLIFTPTTPYTAFRLGEEVDDIYQRYLGDIFTVTANLASLPAISVPVGIADGLPVGGQFIADRWDEATMVRAAAALERLVKE